MFRHLTLLLVLLALLTACGQAAPAAPVSEPASAPVAESITAPTTGSATRTVSHALGEIAVPSDPQRVVTLDPFFTLQNAIALGLPVIGSTTLDGTEPWPAVLTPEEMAKLQPLGDFRQPNLEAITALRPDVIIGAYGDAWNAENYDLLNQIAPTVLISNAELYDWKVHLRRIAEIGGVPERASAGFADYDARVRDLRSRLSDRTVSHAVLWGLERFGTYVQGPEAYAPFRILEEVGVRRPASEVVTDATVSLDLSMEELPKLTGDILFYNIWTNDADTEALLTQYLLANPLWQQLPAVQSGQAYRVDILQWMNFGGLRTAHLILDDIERYLIASAPTATRAITHAMGVTEVPAVPQRVVVLDTSEVDNALALGAPIVGAPVAEVLQYQGYLADQLTGITDIGTISEPNLEAILALKPDLILGSKQRYEAIYPQLSEIAPTVFVESLRVPWQQNFRLHAEALGKTAEAEALLAAYDQRVAELQASLGPERAEITISVIRFRPGQVRLYLKSSFIGYILQDVGLGRPASQDQDTFSAEITLEQIADVDADYLFITGYAQNDSELDTFLNSPLWQTLSAVQNERAIDVDDDHWIAGLGVQAANLVLADLERLVTP